MNLFKHRIFKNVSWILLCKIAQSLLGLVVSMLTARYLGPASFGTINYAASLVSFFSPIALLGLNEILVQEFVHNPESAGQTLGSAIGMSLCSAMLSILGITAFAYITEQGTTETFIVCVLYSTILIFQAVELTQYWFQAKLMSKYTSIISLIAYIAFSAYRIFLLATQKNIFWFAVANAFDACLIAIALVILFKRKSEQALSFSFKCCKQLFSKAKYYIIANLMVVIFAETDKIMLKMMIGEEATGLYSVAVSCVNMTAFVFSAIITSAKPVIIESHLSSCEKFELNMTRLYSVIIFMSLMQSAALTLLAKPIVGILYGADYMEAVSALCIVAWYTSFSYIGGIRNIWILVEEKQKYILPINAFGATVNVALNSVMIPVLGINGAAIATLITQIFTNVVTGYIIKPIRRNNALIVKALNPKVLLSLVHKK